MKDNIESVAKRGQSINSFLSVAGLEHEGKLKFINSDTIDCATEFVRAGIEPNKALMLSVDHGYAGLMFYKDFVGIK